MARPSAFAVLRLMINSNLVACSTGMSAGAILTFFGFMHSEAIGIARAPLVALSYLGVAAVLFGCAKFATASPKAADVHSHGPAAAAD